MVALPSTTQPIEYSKKAIEFIKIYNIVASALVTASTSQRLTVGLTSKHKSDTDDIRQSVKKRFVASGPVEDVRYDNTAH